MMKTIVVSAVNLNVGGALTILRDCLSFLSEFSVKKNYRVVAIVYKKELANFPNIEYIEDQWPKKRWINRLWYEYVSMKKISRELAPVDLWLSLHDTTPNVLAEKQAVYCHNPFPFYEWKWRECLFAPKIVLLSLFSKFIYKKNINKNTFVIVQQQWLKDEFKKLFKLKSDKIIVALPDSPKNEDMNVSIKKDIDSVYEFIYAASPNSHKNFECLCHAAKILENDGINNFKVNITLSGNENKYAIWLYKRYGKIVKSIQWISFQNRKSLFQQYEKCDCLVFPSKVETWGLPISEFSEFNKPMLLADLSYAQETAAGSQRVAFFNPNDPKELAGQMKLLIQGDTSSLNIIPKKVIEEPVTHSWKELFQTLLSEA
ncbi:glycosyltransferase [Elizabethkingia anophelis]|nr:glycosyltransferase [Elizabethkingia anophelis]MDV4119704.1 glycosyltransferase [Elizabethkingia anophelis]